MTENTRGSASGATASRPVLLVWLAVASLLYGPQHFVDVAEPYLPTVVGGSLIILGIFVGRKRSPGAIVRAAPAPDAVEQESELGFKGV